MTITTRYQKTAKPATWLYKHQHHFTVYLKVITIHGHNNGIDVHFTNPTNMLSWVLCFQYPRYTVMYAIFERLQNGTYIRRSIAGSKSNIMKMWHYGIWPDEYSVEKLADINNEGDVVDD